MQVAVDRLAVTVILKYLKRIPEYDSLAGLRQTC